MSDQPVLREAIRALQSLEADHDIAAHTERRLLASLQENAARAYVTRQLVGALLVSVLVAGSAHAAVFGPARTWALLTPWRVSQEKTGAPHRDATHRAPLHRAPSSTVAPSAAHNSSAPSQTTPQLASSAPRPAASSPAPRRLTKANPAHAPVVNDVPMRAASADELYDDAHRLHFKLGDKHAALAAWDRYLAVQPAGGLALEAQYNRALCLLALKRTGQAIDALRAIATSEQSQYHAASAKRLLKALLDNTSSHTR